MAFNDGVKVGPIAYIGLVSVLVTFAVVLLLQVLYFRHSNDLSEANLAAELPDQELSVAVSDQQEALEQRGYVDRDRGIVAVGVSRAKELVVTELAEGKLPKEVNGPEPPAKPVAKQPDDPKEDPSAKATEEDAGEDQGAETPKVEQEPEDEENA